MLFIFPESSNSTQLLLNQAIEEADKELGIPGISTTMRSQA